MRQTEEKRFTIPGVQDDLVVRWAEGAGAGAVTCGEATLLDFDWLDELEGQRVLEVAPGLEVTLQLQRSSMGEYMWWSVFVDGKRIAGSDYEVEWRANRAAGLLLLLGVLHGFGLMIGFTTSETAAIVEHLVLGAIFLLLGTAASYGATWALAASVPPLLLELLGGVLSIFVAANPFGVFFRIGIRAYVLARVVIALKRAWTEPEPALAAPDVGNPFDPPERL